VQYLLGSLLVLFLLALLVGAVTGRVKTTGCCAANPRRDLRMRDAFRIDDRHADDAADAGSGSARRTY
jgi:hypothetical protein